ncbi:FAD-dependent monooxygenase [Actinokineospora bangkokensis]|uniref:FAD-binding monooxygenase n=1 Tax=Actinokineospora bangkokensis TaxID=1193682 RepID=A0A1Q9LMJ0_9PSEU|nr:FAD-dependent monooxygenase [Actinokineospora bangkokensis]OLR93225.1 FAD-binding monooxygenase [Actinokineospora bangkokensis]
MTDVLVVGAGPVGLLLAGELAGAGVGATVVDRLTEPMTESRASQLSTRSAELLAERGLRDLLAEAVPEPRSHFAGLGFDLSGVDSPLAGNWKVAQHRTEAALTRWALDRGARLLRGHQLVGLTQHDDHVLARFAGRDPLRAEYLVGADGQDSAVRGLAGFDYDLVPATRELLRADVTGITVPDRRFERLPGGLAVAATRGGVTRVMVHAHDRGVTGGRPDFAEVARTWARVTGEDISGGTPLWVDAFDNARGHARRYRRGRVFLAGDAAHRHLPIGGQALNTGLADAVSLGRALGPGGSLDGYHDERHPAGAEVLRWVAAQEDLLLGGPEVEPVRSVLAELVALPQVQTHLATRFSGVRSSA